MLAARNAQRSAGAKKTNVVERQAVAVLSRGTLTDAEMVGASPDAAYVLAGGLGVVGVGVGVGVGLGIRLIGWGPLGLGFCLGRLRLAFWGWGGLAAC